MYISSARHWYGMATEIQNIKDKALVYKNIQTTAGLEIKLDFVLSSSRKMSSVWAADHWQDDQVGLHQLSFVRKGTVTMVLKQLDLCVTR